jgi:hypothetical protein
MIEETALKDELDEDEQTGEADDASATDEDVVEEGSDNIGDPSVEINVEALIHELESQSLANQLNKEHEARRRLEELMERRRARRDLEDFDDYDI